MQLEHMHVTDCNRTIKCLACPSVIKRYLARSGKAGELQHVLDLMLRRTIKYRGCERHAILEIFRQIEYFIIGKRSDILLPAAGVINLVEQRADLDSLAAGAQQITDLRAQPFCRPPKMGFENLADIHARRHSEGIQHYIDGRAISHIRHVFRRHDLGNYAFISMTSGHFIPGLQTALYRHVDLDHFLYARWQLIALCKFLLLLLKSKVKGLAFLR